MEIQPMGTAPPVAGKPDWAAKAIIANAEASFVDGLSDHGEVTMRHTMNKDLKIPPPKKQGGGGIFGFLSSIFKPIAALLSFIPGIGQLASFVLNMVSQVFTLIENLVQSGKIKVEDIMSSIASMVTSVIPGAGALGGMGVQGLNGLLQAGKIAPMGMAHAMTQMMGGLPGGGFPRQAFEAGLGVIAKAVADGRIDARDLAGVLAPVGGLPGGLGGVDALRGLGGLVDAGALHADEVAEAVAPLIGAITDDPDAKQLLHGVLDTVTGVVTEGRVSARDVVDVAVHGIKKLF